MGTLYSLSLESSNQARMRVGNHVTLVSCSHSEVDEWTGDECQKVPKLRNEPNN